MNESMNEGDIKHHVFNNTPVDKNILFELQYPGMFPASNMYILKFGKIPNFYKFDKKFTDEVIKLFDIKVYKKIHESRRIDEKGKEYIDGYVFEKGESFFIIDREYQEEDENYLLSINIYYKDFEDICEKVEEIKKYINKPKYESKINLIVKSSYGGYTLSDFNVKKVKVDIGLNYGHEFEKKHNIMINFLKNPEKTGLIMLHGLPGTGKSTYIKYLTNKLRKKFIFFPSNMAEDLTSPSFVEFMINQKDSILVIEDAEKLIKSRDTFSSNGISNLLNVTDGILGDIMKIKIIATHNTKKEEIDQALLRKGRLIVEHEFDKLSEESVEKLLKHLKIDYKKDDIKAMTLTDVYNLKEEVFISKKNNKIGFV
jgi:hypothetical protein